jgi:hypothetical protein
MKKTKTGLHIQTRKNRIEVYTEKELQQKLIAQEEARNMIIRLAIMLFAGLMFVLGYLLGS